VLRGELVQIIKLPLRLSEQGDDKQHAKEATPPMALLRTVCEAGESVAILPINGYTMAYDMEGEGIPLVFLHQVATDRRLWHHQWSTFCQRYRLITVDTMGHGQVTWPPKEFSFECTATSVHTLLEQLKTGPAFLIGVSMGAAIAMRVALSNPLAVRGLILISPWIHASEHTRSLVDRLFRLAEGGHMSAHTDLFLRYVLPPAYLAAHGQEVERLRTLAMEQDAKAVAYTWAACMASDLSDCLRAIHAPSLVIAGLNDLFTPPYLARVVADGLSEVELEIWEEAGHFPFFEDPSRFNRRLEVFIRRCLTQAHAE
jgi:3-oxoadipate enol-lactonase